MSNFSFYKRTGKGVAARWRTANTNHISTGNPYWFDDKKEAIYNELVALGDNPDPDQVDAIIGNNSWTYACCNGDENHSYVDRAVIITSYSSCVTLCMECFKELQACVEAGNK